MSESSEGVGDLRALCDAKLLHFCHELLDATQGHENKRANSVRSCKESPCNRLGLTTPTNFRMTSAKLKPPACTSSRFRMLFLPFKCTRLIPPVSYMCAMLRSVSSLRVRCNSLLRFPRVRRRLAYTCFCSSCFPSQFRGPLSGSGM